MKRSQAASIFTVAVMLVAVLVTVHFSFRTTGWGAVLWYALAVAGACLGVAATGNLAVAVLTDWAEEFFEEEDGDPEPPVTDLSGYMRGERE